MSKVRRAAARPCGDNGVTRTLIRDLADAGAAVVVISSYLSEILSISDRILVARQGRIVKEMSIEEASEEAIMHAAVH